ncbi:hypothetical protein Rin_00023380 [Candidatus Regiella insecticola 5.15]|uniref:CS1 type fimbrial major subunit n=1 Tax=Candidatus Regiella insecticola 5.15 TaxID=1005043 RepID=G2H2N0_9ENTR|nr:CS1 type fimbrial major subunit [Candidatus Regiella insecticola]EGY27749.1 hypothetical protein Rin_00023380 [Candidatus Regiella insecticola 5.15]
MKKIITKNAPLFATAVLALSTLFTASHANESSSSTLHEIKVKTEIFGTDFYTKPTQSNIDSWNFKYNEIAKKFDPLIIKYDFKNSEGSIKAKLTSEAKLDNVNKIGEKIELDVKICNAELKTNVVVEVVDQASAKIGTQKDIIITSKDENPKAGKYEGTIMITFDAMAGETK